jgi:hypothetical protein
VPNFHSFLLFAADAGALTAETKAIRAKSEKVSLHGVLPSVNTIVLPCDLHWDVTGITESEFATIAHSNFATCFTFDGQHGALGRRQFLQNLLLENPQVY